MKQLILFLIALLPLASCAQSQRFGDVDFAQVRKLQMAELAVASLYVDSVDQEKLVEDAINGMLGKLDPHSSYTNAKDTKKLNEPLSGNFEGIGVSFNMVKDTLVVLQVISKGPCEKVGMQAGDRITAVNGIAISGVKMDKDSIMTKLRGPKGTVANLDVVRKGTDGLLHFKVVRDKIPLYTVDAAYMITPTAAYIHLDSFGATSGQEVHDKILEFRKQGMKDIILDLSLNGGGYLNAAQEVASEFLPEGSLIVFTDGRAAPRQELRSEGNGLMRDNGRVVILVDEFTASAAEIVSGAVQDNDRGTIIGRRTFGKGLVQRPVDLPDGSMIRLTVSHYYTPSGRCIQKPYVKGEKSEYEHDLDNRYTRGEFVSVDSIHLDSTKVYKTLKEGRTVYGGGGIMPDIFVPLDTTAYTPYYRGLRRYNLIVDAQLRYVDEHRKELTKKYRKFEAYEANFTVPQELLDSIVAEGKRKKLEPKDDKELEATLADLRFTLKAGIAYNLWDRTEYYRLVNKRSDLVKRAVEFLNEGKK